MIATDMFDWPSSEILLLIAVDDATGVGCTVVPLGESDGIGPARGLAAARDATRECQIPHRRTMACEMSEMNTSNESISEANRKNVYHLKCLCSR